MPESANGSGQCDSVTGNALHIKGREGQSNAPLSSTEDGATRSAAASALTIAQQNVNRDAHRQPQSSYRPSPIRLIPVSSTSHAPDNDALLPPSPPSTPSSSPPGRQASLSTESSSSQAFSLQTELNLRSVLASLPQTSDDKIGNENFPDTPEATPSTISPADSLGIRHRPASFSRDFVARVIPDLSVVGAHSKQQAQQGRYIVEDASMEIVSPGWTGAIVIDTKPTTSVPPSSNAFSPGSPRSRATMASNVSRISSSSSLHNMERVSPRRTLLTRMAARRIDGELLRTRILDVLDHATERLHADNVVFVIDRSTLDEEEFRAIVHGLCYVGASIIGHGASDAEQVISSAGQPQHYHTSTAETSDESLHAPRKVAPNLVLLSVDV